MDEDGRYDQLRDVKQCSPRNQNHFRCQKKKKKKDRSVVIGWSLKIALENRRKRVEFSKEKEQKWKTREAAAAAFLVAGVGALKEKEGACWRKVEQAIEDEKTSYPRSQKWIPGF